MLSRELAEQGLGVKEATALPSVLEPVEYAQYPCSEPPSCGSMASHPPRQRDSGRSPTDKQSLRCGLSGRKTAHVSVGYSIGCGQQPAANGPNSVLCDGVG